MTEERNPSPGTVERLRIPLEPPRYGRSGTVVAVLSSLAYWSLLLGVTYAFAANDVFEQSVLLLLLMLIPGIAIGRIALRRLLSGRGVSDIELHEAFARLPRGSVGTRTVDMPYSEVGAIHVRGRPPRRWAVVAGPPGSFVFPEGRFASADHFELFVMDLRRRIRSQPDGEMQLKRIDMNSKLTRVTLGRSVRVTYALVLAIAVVFVFELATGALEDLFALVRYGANAAALVQDGQLYRLVTANFLHASWLHIYLNAAALISLGVVVERLLGGARFVVVYLASAVGGSAVSAAVAQGILSVAASTAIFGVLGALFVVNVAYRKSLPQAFRQSARWWIFILGINGALPLVVPQIDVGAHAGGFLAGAAVTLAFVNRLDVRDLLTQAPGRPARLAAVFCVLVTLAGLAIGVKEALTPNERNQQLLLESYVARDDLPPDALNTMAWFVVSQGRPAESTVAVARRAAERALAGELSSAAERAAILDTLATATYLLGDFAEAAEIERRSIAAEDRPLLWSQLARFELARFEREGPTSPGPVATMTAVLGEGRTTLRLDLDGPLSGGGQAFAVAIDRGAPIGHVRVRLPPTHPLELTWDDPACPCNAWPASVQLAVTRIDAEAAGPVTWTVSSFDPEVTGLPKYGDVVR